MQNTYITIYLILINTITFIIYGIDKKRARNHEWRIPEKTLLLLALAGGSIGAYAGMQTFRHKTQKPLFKFGVPFIFLLQVAVLVRLISHA